MGMNPRLLRPRQTTHPEAADWANRVRTAGGSVSGSTLAAVDRFVKSIYAAGIRDLFFRLNLFCGNSDASLIAPRVPLFRGPSFTGMQYGNALDANVNFVQGDYSEANGLTGNGSTKYLQTGLQPSALATGGNIRSHLSVYKRTDVISGVQVSSRASSPARTWELGAGGNSAGDNAGSFSPPTPNNSLITVTRTTDTELVAFRNAQGSSPIAYPAVTQASNVPFAVFCRNAPATDTNTYTPSLFSNQTLAAYSIGHGLTGAQVVAYNAAMQAFQSALGRAVA